MRRRLVPLATIAAAALCAAVPAFARQAPPQPSPQGTQAVPRTVAEVQQGTVIEPETVTVGEPFRVQVRVRAPAGSRIEFPIGPDSAATIELLDPKRVRTTDSTTTVDQFAVYRMVAWDLGSQPLRMGDVIVLGPGGERRIPLGGLDVFVRSVLPQDSAQRVPKPPRPPFAVEPPWWRYWWVAAIALALGLLVWWLVRRKRRRAGADVAVDPYELAEREFARVERMGLLEAGERGRFVALMVEVLRDYLARRVTDAHPSLTSGELLRALRLETTVPIERLAIVLEESDLIKFARGAVSPERARELAHEARAIVKETDRRVAERRAAEAAREAALQQQRAQRPERGRAA